MINKKHKTPEKTIIITEFNFNLNCSKTVRFGTTEGANIVRTNDDIYVLIDNKFIVQYILDNCSLVKDFGSTVQLNLRSCRNRAIDYYVSFPNDNTKIKVIIKEEEIQEWREN